MNHLSIRSQAVIYLKKFLTGSSMGLKFLFKLIKKCISSIFSLGRNVFQFFDNNARNIENGLIIIILSIFGSIFVFIAINFLLAIMTNEYSIIENPNLFQFWEFESRQKILLGAGVFISATTMLITMMELIFSAKIADHPSKIISEEIAIRVKNTATTKYKDEIDHLGDDILTYTVTRHAGQGVSVVTLYFSLNQYLSQMNKIPDLVAKISREKIKISIFTVFWQVSFLAFILVMGATSALALSNIADFDKSAIIAVDTILRGSFIDFFEAYEISLVSEKLNASLIQKHVLFGIRTLTSFVLIAIIVTKIKLLVKQKKIRSKYLDENHEEFIYCCGLTQRELAQRLTNIMEGSEFSMDKEGENLLELYITKIKELRHPILHS